MRKVKAFFHVFLNSLLPHYPYYHTILKTKFSRSFSYFAMLSIIAYVVFIFLFSLKYQPIKQVKTLTDTFIASLHAYPENLIITVTNGMLTTNYNRPYLMWMNSEDSKLLLLVVDPNATPSDASKYNAMSLATGHDIVVKDVFRPTHYNVTPLQSSLSTVVTKSRINEVIATVQEGIRTIYMLLPLLIIILFPLITLCIVLLSIVVSAAMIYTVGKVMHRRITFHKTFQLGLHAVTLPLIVTYALGLFNFGQSIFPYSFFILLTVFIAGAVYEAHLESK